MFNKKKKKFKCVFNILMPQDDFFKGHFKDHHHHKKACYLTIQLTLAIFFQGRPLGNCNCSDSNAMKSHSTQMT